MGAAEAVTLLLALLDKASAWAAVVGKAQAEKRDVTDAEVNAFQQADLTAAQREADAILRRRLAG